MPTRSVLHVSQILEWADAYHKHSGKWPTPNSGRIVGDADITWCAVNHALSNGNRGFPGGWSLARLLSEYRGKRLKAQQGDLTIEQILKWADAYHKRTKTWPSSRSGAVVGTAGVSWQGINQALRYGLRGLPGKSSLAMLLAERRGRPNRAAMPPLSVQQILKWADAHRAQTGDWPTIMSRRIAGADHENWAAINAALKLGYRGLPGGSSLVELLAKHRGKRNQHALPPFTIKQILKWADAHYRRTGEWPTQRSGPITRAAHETWIAVEGALKAGLRGLPGGSSIAKLLADHRGKRNPGALPPFTIRQILEWADAHHQRTGTWPTQRSQRIVGADQETWMAVESALNAGTRGLPGGSSIAQLLAEHRGRRNSGAPPRLSVEQILAWADAHHKRTGIWPSLHSGPVADAEHETWNGVDLALRSGLRGLPSKLSIAKLLARHGRKRHQGMLPRFTVKQILAWADGHLKRTGAWPTKRSGPLADAEETWMAINSALRTGTRGLPGGSSLAKLLNQRRRRSRPRDGRGGAKHP